MQVIRENLLPIGRSRRLGEFAGNPTGTFVELRDEAP